MNDISAPAAAAPTRQRFDYLPVGLFGSVMGLTGLSVAWRLAHARYGAPEWMANAIGIVAVAAFVLLTLGYAAKLVPRQTPCGPSSAIRSPAICSARS